MQTFFGLIILLLAHIALRGYSGPTRLGYFSIEHPTRIQRLYEVLGYPESRSGNHVCYRGAGGSFMWADKMAHDRAHVGTVMVSLFPACADAPYTDTKADFREWKTPAGIGLGSPERNIIKAYGRPTVRRRMGAFLYPGIIHGDVDANGLLRRLPHGVKPGDLGQEELGYGGGGDDVRAALFGMRDGRVVWIYLNNNE